MKVLYSILISCLLYYSQLSGQFTGLGINGGGNIASFDYQNGTQGLSDFENSSKLGGAAGIKLDFNLSSENLKFTPEIFINQNGSKEFYTDLSLFQNDVISRTVSLDYIGAYLPLNLYIPLDDGTGITDYYYNGLFASASIYFDYVIGSDLSSDFHSKSKLEFRNSSDKMDFGVALMAGFLYENMLIQFGYDHGIKNIEFADESGGQSNSLVLVNNRGFTLKVGYMYKLE